MRRRCTTMVQAAQPKSLSTSRSKHLEQLEQIGGGGIRTPVPRCFKTSIYMLSRFIAFSPCQTPNDRLLVRLFRKVLTSPARTTGLASLLCDALTQPTGKIGQDGLPN